MLCFQDVGPGGILVAEMIWVCVLAYYINHLQSTI